MPSQDPFLIRRPRGALWEETNKAGCDDDTNCIKYKISPVWPIDVIYCIWTDITEHPQVVRLKPTWW